MPKDDRLVWTSATNDDWMKTHFNILFTNSHELGTGDLYNAGVAAFKAGMEHNFS